VLASSNSGSLVNFSAGTKFVFCDYPAGRAVYLDTATNVTIPGLTLSGGTANGVLYLNGSKVATSGSALTFDGTNLGVGGTGYSRFSTATVLIGNNGYANAFRMYDDGSASTSQTGNSYGFGFIQNGAVSYTAGTGGYHAFFTANTERIRLDPSGNLGIGTSSPTQRLEVSGDIQQQNANYLRGKLAAGTGTRLFGLNSANSLYVGGIDASQSEILFVRGGATQMVLDANGNLGIGTSSPVGRVDSVSNASSAFTARASTTGANQTATVLNVYNSDASLFALAQYNAVQHIWGYAGATEGMRLNASGNLGIGTSSPSGRLHISTASGNTEFYNNVTGSGTAARTTYTRGGTIQFLAGLGAWSGTDTYQIASSSGPLTTLDTSGNLGIGTSSPAARLDVTGIFNGTQAVFGNTAGRGLLIGTALNGGTNEATIVLNARGAGAGRFLFQTDGTDRMVLDQAGNLGIGITSPSTYGNLVLVRSQNSDTRVWVRNEDAGSSSRCSYALNASGNSWSMGMGSIANNGNALTWVLDVGGGNNEMMRLTTSGNLGIGGTLGTTPSLNKGVYLQSDTNNHVIGYSLYVNDGVNSRRGSMFLDDSTGVWGWDVTASSGIPYYVWRVANAEKMRLTDDGKLALAEGNAPTQIISIYRTGSTNAIMSAGNSNTGLDGTWFGVDTAGNGIVNVRGAFPLLFSTNSLERMRLDSSGNLGIGTSSPGSLLEVNGTSNLGGTAAAPRVGVGTFAVGVASMHAGGGNALQIGTTGANEMALFQNNAAIVRLLNSNMGLRTTDCGASAVGCFGIANATTVPTGAPAGGGVLYVEAGALKYRGSSGTVTTIANA
jgi:hypothetical protein